MEKYGGKTMTNSNKNMVSSKPVTTLVHTLLVLHRILPRHVHLFAGLQIPRNTIYCPWKSSISDIFWHKFNSHNAEAWHQRLFIIYMQILILIYTKQKLACRNQSDGTMISIAYFFFFFFFGNRPFIYYCTIFGWRFHGNGNKITLVSLFLCNTKYKRKI